jgi:hypothetical protein
MFKGALNRQVEARDLQVDAEYTTRDVLMLMPAVDASKLTGKDERIYQLKPRSVFKVLKVEYKREKPWYHVEVRLDDSQRARGDKKRSKLKGWFNAIGLIGKVFAINDTPNTPAKPKANPDPPIHDTERVRCKNCEWKGIIAELKFHEENDVVVKECPECGAEGDDLKYGK